MRLGPKIMTMAAILIAALGSYLSAVFAADFIERGSGNAAQTALLTAGHDWAEITTDGLQVRMGGLAPTEAERFRALTVLGTVVDTARVIDVVEVAASKPIAPPRFSIELLRNAEGVSLIGLIPAETDREALTNRIKDAIGRGSVTDLLEVANHRTPDGWYKALTYGIDAMEKLEKTKISISAGQVSITAIADDSNEKRRLETQLSRLAPAGLRLAVNIRAPRQVITPFTLRFLIDAEGSPRFDACSADSEGARARILAAAREAGMEDKANCTLGLGAPTSDWAEAAVQSIRAIAELGGGSVTMADADITLVALETTEQRTFDQVVGTLESNLPDIFSLSSVLPEKKENGADEGPPEFTATLSPEGQVQLRGRIPDEQTRVIVESMAKSHFGSEAVSPAMRVTEGLPDRWSVRVLAGLGALAELQNGLVVVQPELVEVRGQTGSPGARAEIARLLSEKLGEGQNLTIAVRYVEALDPLADIPTAEECVGKIDAILSATKITFEPGSTEITGTAVRVMDQIADVLKDCSSVEMQLEIGGYTDSQGREEMNLDLSEKRAAAVLEALVARRVLTANITAKGYGEANPIASNDTDEGRERNRRIEFRLVTADGDEAEAAEEDQEAEAQE